MRGSFKLFRPYVRLVQRLSMLRVPKHKNADWMIKADRTLDGEPSKELRSRIDLRCRRRFGTFFTGSTLAELAISQIGRLRRQDAVFADPACGAGDLLIAAARQLPLKRTLNATLRCWGRHLLGGDLQPEFVATTKARLLLLARQKLRLAQASAPDPARFFPYIRSGDALKSSAGFQTATIILLNPPFSPVAAPTDCNWASGSVNSAAVFVHSLLSRMEVGTYLVAILPEVLRTGSRYRRWREEVSQLARITKVQRYGVFDSLADVDVFVAVFMKRQRIQKQHARSEWRQQRNARSTLGRHFTVSVGPLVPFRHRKQGDPYSYLHPRNAPTWALIKRISEKRRFSGPLLRPPFVVIRRTSRPGDKHRAVGSLVLGKRLVAVENHLIICKPRRGGRSACEHLLKQLKSERTNGFLNERICCRHLTVTAVKSLPYSYDGRRTSSKR
jgi:hypothetical protein